jgi:hypothetical protein
MGRLEIGICGARGTEAVPDPAGRRGGALKVVGPEFGRDGGDGHGKGPAGGEGATHGAGYPAESGRAKSVADRLVFTLRDKNGNIYEIGLDGKGFFAKEGKKLVPIKAPNLP